MIFQYHNRHYQFIMTPPHRAIQFHFACLDYKNLLLMSPDIIPMICTVHIKKWVMPDPLICKWIYNTILYYSCMKCVLLYLMLFMQQNLKKNNFWATVTKHFSVFLEKVDKNLVARNYNICVSQTIDSNDFCDHVTCHAAPPAVQRETLRQLWDFVQTFMISLSSRVWTETL